MSHCIEDRCGASRASGPFSGTIRRCWPPETAAFRMREDFEVITIRFRCFDAAGKSPSSQAAKGIYPSFTGASRRKWENTSITVALPDETVRAARGIPRLQPAHPVPPCCGGFNCRLDTCRARVAWFRESPSCLRRGPRRAPPDPPGDRIAGRRRSGRPGTGGSRVSARRKTGRVKTAGT